MKIVVIGGGPGGYVAAIRAAQLGADVKLIERDKLGGTCLNVGCIPTKALLHTAEVYAHAKEGASCGVNAAPSLDFAKAQNFKTSIVDKLVGGVTGLMKANKIEVIKAEASFAGPKRLLAGGKEIPFDRVIIAAGSRPAIPPIPGIDAKQCIDSTGALALTEVPKHLLIIGGGVIGVEMASLYSTLGAKVTIVEMLPQILPMMDKELTAIQRKLLEKKGIRILTDAAVKAVSDQGENAIVTVELGGKKEEIAADKVLVSVGRRTDTEALNLAAAGIQNDRGKITVDAYQRTNVPGIYAIGDCTGGSMLAHVASVQGELAVENAMGAEEAYDGKTNPSCIYTDPEFAGVGLTEEKAKEQGLDYIVGKFPLSANGKSLIMGGQDGVIKILAGKEFGEILGVHILGPRATDLIAEGALAIGTESTLDEIIHTIHAHPTVGEAVREAALAAENRAIHIPNKR